MTQEKNAPRQTPDQAFGSALQHFRRERGISQEHLAHTAGYHSTYISQLERGLKTPTLTTILDLAAVLQVKASELVERVEVTLARNV